EDPEVEALRKEIRTKASNTNHLCSILDNTTISDYWALLKPICEFIRSSVDDEESIPSHLGKMDVKIAETRRKLDASNLNEVIALNLLQLFSDFVKLLKIAPTASATHSTLVKEVEKMKRDNFTLRTENEKHKQALERSRMGRETIREVMSTFEIEDDESKREKGVVSIIKGPPLDVSSYHCAAKEKKAMEWRASTRAKRTSVMTRTFTSCDARMNYAADSSLVYDTPPSVPSASSALSILPPPSSPHPEEKEHVSFKLILANLLGSNHNENGKELTETNETKREKKEERTIRRRRAESPMMEEEGMEKKRACVESSQANGGGEDGKYKCPFDGCGRAFPKRSTLTDHATSDHYWQGVIQLECTHCHFVFDNDRTFDNHLVNCKYGDASAYAKMWEQQDTEAEQGERLRLEKELLTCPYDDCDYESKSRSRCIFKHMTKSHSNDGRAYYKCECGKRRRSLHTILFHRYSECRNSEIVWMIDSPLALKKDEDEDEDDV
ncbi:hypothetical protein PENTCL1PPCAC_11556, partial [Pristionchus entomophagus]